MKARHPHWAGSLLLQKTLLKNLRPEVQAVTLDECRPAAQQIAQALESVREQHFVLAAINDAPLLHHQNLIAVGQGRKPVGDDDHRPPAGNALQVGLVH